MRYIKVLLLAAVFFLALIFFFQNQNVLSGKMDLKFDPFFFPPIKTMSLPLYFLMICSFFLGVLFSVCFLVWDRLNLSARIMKDKWQIQNLASKLAKAEKMVQQQGKKTFGQRVADFFSLDQATPVRSKEAVKALGDKDQPQVSKLPPKNTQNTQQLEEAKPVVQSEAANQSA